VETVRCSPTLASLFNSVVAAREYHGVASVDALYAEEAALVAKAVPSRQAAFAAGRLCARSALQAIAAVPSPVLWDDARAPVWPQGVVGSITHTEGFCGAVVAGREEYDGIGIDAERRESVHEEIWEQVLTAAERTRLLACHDLERREAATIIFCAKEAFYKAQYQVTGSWLGFENADVRLENGEFTIELMIDMGTFERAQRFMGKYTVLPGIVVTGIALPPARIPVRAVGC